MSNQVKNVVAAQAVISFPAGVPTYDARDGFTATAPVDGGAGVTTLEMMIPLSTSKATFAVALLQATPVGGQSFGVERLGTSQIRVTTAVGGALADIPFTLTVFALPGA